MNTKKLNQLDNSLYQCGSIIGGKQYDRLFNCINVKTWTDELISSIQNPGKILFDKYT
jgi:hypothetical protein